MYKFEIRNSKSETNTKSEIRNSKRYDLEERTFNFTKRVIDYVNNIPKTLTNIEIARQLIRAAGSVGSNYIEANESLGKRDLAMKIKTSRKESKESNYWLRLSNPKMEQTKERDFLVQESVELMNIFGAILKKLK